LKGVRALNRVRHIVAWIKNNWALLKWPFALILLGYLFYQNRRELAQLASRQIDWFDFGAAVVLCGLSAVLTFYRWYLLVWSLDLPFRIRDSMRLGFIGYLFNFVGPGTAGGDVVKAAMIATEQKSRRGIAAATVLLDRILGLLALFMVGALATLFMDRQLLQDRKMWTCVVLLWVGTIGGVLGLAIMLHPAVPRSRLLARLIQLPKVGHMIYEVVNAVLLYQQRRAILVLTVVLSIVGHFWLLSSFYLCALAINAGNVAPGYWMHLLLIPIVELFAVILPVPGGVGAIEGGVGYAYLVANEAMGLPTVDAVATGVAVGLAFRIATIVIAAVGAGYYLTSRSEIGRIMSEQEPPSALGERG